VTPASVAPLPASTTPASLVSASATSLSLSLSMVVTRSTTVGPGSEATVVAPGGAVPAVVGPATVTPARPRAALNSSPLPVAGSARNAASVRWRLSSTVSADSGPT
jgi:hypothetical protein